MKLLTRESPPLQHKTLSVLQHFDREFYDHRNDMTGKYHEQMIREGLLTHLVRLMSSGNIHLRIKAFETAHDLVGNRTCGSE